MAQRPIFMPHTEEGKFVQEQYISFEWYPGFSLSQTQKSIKSLHSEVSKKGIRSILEISSKSLQPLGVQLSAFNLRLSTNGYTFSVESAYQGSKVFEQGGPFTDIYTFSSRDAKKDDRIKSSGNLNHFDFFGQKWNLQPTTAFYDWLYIQALVQNPQLSSQLTNFAAFSDIAFNPQKSFSCQARSSALYVSLLQTNNLEQALSTPANFLVVVEATAPQSSVSQVIEQTRLL